MPVQQPVQAAQRHRARKALFVPADVHQILAHGLFDEQRLRVLRQQPHAPMRRDLAAQRLQKPCQHAQRRGFSRTVRAQQCIMLAPADRHRQPAQHLRRVLFIRKPHLARREHRLGLCAHALRWKFAKRMGFDIFVQPRASLADRDGTNSIGICRAPDAHRGGHGVKHPAPLPSQQRADLARRGAAQQPPVLQNGGAVGIAQRLFQTVLAQDDRCAELAVDPAQHGEKIRRRDGVELARRLVEQQHARLHRHHGRQTQKLLLPAGQLRYILVKPVLNPKKRRHFGNAPADDRRFIAQRLQPEGKLVPDLVGHDLIFGILQHKADRARLLAARDLLQRYAAEYNLPAARTVRRKHALELPQQRRFAAAGRAAEHQKFSVRHRERDLPQRRGLLARIGKRQVADLIARHAQSSLQSRISGIRHSAA